MRGGEKAGDGAGVSAQSRFGEVAAGGITDVALLELVGMPAGVGLPLRLPFFGVLHQFLKGDMVVFIGSREEVPRGCDRCEQQAAGEVCCTQGNGSDGIDTIQRYSCDSFPGGGRSAVLCRYRHSRDREGEVCPGGQEMCYFSVPLCAGEKCPWIRECD